MVFFVNAVLVNEQLEFPVFCGEFSFLNLSDKRFVFHPVFDKVGDGQNGDVVGQAVIHQFRHPGHSSVFVHDFADDACRIEACQPCDVDRRFGLAGSFENAAVFGLQGKNVSRARKV